jgi:hypothetical protein
VTSRGIYNEPHRTLERVRDALRERGVRVPSRFKERMAAPFPNRGVIRALNGRQFRRL